MNRANRRRIQRQENKDPVLNVKESKIRQELEKLSSSTVREAAKMASALFALVLNSEYGFGKKRIDKVLERVNYQMECVLSGHLSGKDIYGWCEEKKLSYFEMESKKRVG